MHLNLHLFQISLLTAAVFALPSDPLHKRSQALTKRHFWCNGVDSETICPPGETMVPIDSYACSTIASAGRLSQISPPVNGETSTQCPQQQQQQQPPAQNNQQQPPAQNNQQQPPPESSQNQTQAQNPEPQTQAQNPQQNAETPQKEAESPQQPESNLGNMTPDKMSLESTPFSSPVTQMNLTCTEVSNGQNGSGMLLNCTTGA